MKHLHGLSKDRELPKKAGIPIEFCDELRKISRDLAREAGCPPTKKERLGFE